MAFSDGTLLKVEYDDNGIWRFKVICKGNLYDKKVEGSVSEDTNDKVYFKSGLVWCVFAKDMQMDLIRARD